MMVSRMVRGFCEGVDSRKQKHIIKYSQQMPIFFKHEDILMEEQIYGRTCYIGVRNIHQINHPLRPAQSTPILNKHIILGAFSNNDFKTKFNTNTTISSILYQPQKMFCKSQFSSIVQKQLHSNIDIFFEDQKRYFLIVDHPNRRICTDDYLTAAYQSIFIDDCKLTYGLPSDILVFEELMLSLPLQQLQAIFYRTADKINKRHPHEYIYNAGVVVDMLRQYALEDEPALYSKQKLYMMALLRKYVKVQDHVLLIAPNTFVREMAENVHQVDVDPTKIYRNFLEDKSSQNYARLHQIISNGKVEEVLEKFAILNLIKKNNLEIFLIEGNNIFLNSIFKPIFAHINTQQIISMYRNIKRKYVECLWDVQAFFMKNIIDYRLANPYQMKIQEHFNLIDSRKKDFPVTFTPQTYQTIGSIEDNVAQLHKKMEEIVIREGDQHDIQLLRSHLQGESSKQSIILYSKLIGKAIIQLPTKIKLPIFHFGAFRGFYKQYLKDYLIGKSFKKKKEKIQFKMPQIDPEDKQFIKTLEDPQELQKYITGQKGKVIKHINIYDGDDDQPTEMEADPNDIEELAKVLENIKKNNKNKFQ